MSTLVVKNLPEQLHKALKARARKHHRSLNKEAASIIEQAVYSSDGQSQTQVASPSASPLSLEDLDLALSDNHYGRLSSLTGVEELMDELRGERIDPRG